MTSRTIFPGIGLATPNTCMGPVLDNITVSDITVTNLLTANNVNVTGTIVIQNIIESLLIKTNMIEEFTPGAGVTINDGLYLTNPSLLAAYNVYDTSGGTLRGQVSVRGSSALYDASLRMTSGPSGAFIFEGASVPYMTLFNDGGVGKMRVDRVSPNATTAVSIDSLVVGGSTSVIPGGVRYNSNVLEVCDNLGVWGPTFTAGGSIDITNRVISLSPTISVTNLNGDAVLGVTAQRLIISPTSLLLPGALRYDAGVMYYSDGTVWKALGGMYTAGNSISISASDVISLSGDILINSIRGLSTTNTTFISIASNDATTVHTPLQYYASARTGDTSQLIFGRDSTDSAIIKHNYIAASNPNNSIQVGVIGATDILVGYAGGYSSIRQPTIVGAGITTGGNLGFAGDQLSVYTGTSRKNIALIDPTSGSVMSDGILSSSNSVTFYPSNVTATDTRFMFSNILGGIGGQLYSVDTWATDDSIYMSTYASRFVYRGKINNVLSTPWATTSGVNGVSGVLFDYMAVGQNLASTPILGSFATDATGFMKMYNGTDWKFLVPMNASSRVAECNGIVSSANPTLFSPSSATGIDKDYVFSNAVGGTGKTYTIGVWETGDMLYMTSRTSNFVCNATINNTPAQTWASSVGAGGVNGVRYDYMVVGQNLATTPIAGSFTMDLPSLSLRYHTGTEWRSLVSTNLTEIISASGMVSSNNPVSFYPTSAVPIDNSFVFSNVNPPTGGQRYKIEPWAADLGMYVTSYSNKFSYRGTINGVEAIPWAETAGVTGNNGVLFNYMVVGQGQGLTPVLGSFATDAPGLSLKFYTGTGWKFLAHMDMATKLVEANGILGGSSPMIFQPNSAVASDQTFTFRNSSGGDETYNIALMDTTSRAMMTTRSTRFSYRGNVNGAFDTTWVQSAGDAGVNGVQYDYMLVGQTLAGAPLLGSFATDATGYMKMYNGTAWKFLAPLDETTKLVEANGIESLGNIVNFNPSNTTAANTNFIFSNRSGSGGQEYSIDPWADNNTVYVTSFSDNFIYRGKVNNVGATPFMLSAGVNGVNGVNHDFMLVGSSLATTPVLGSFASDAAGFLKMYNGSAWKFLTPMDTALQRAEMQGIVMTNNTFEVRPTSAVNVATKLSIGNNSSTGSSGFEIDLSGTVSDVIVETKKDNAKYRHTIEGAPQDWVSLSNTGATYGHMKIGTLSPSVPSAGQFRYWTPTNVLQVYNGTAWLNVYAGPLPTPEVVYYNVFATIQCARVGGNPQHTLLTSTGSPTFPYPTGAGLVGVDWVALPAGWSYFFTVTIQRMSFGTQSLLRFRVTQGGYFAQIYPTLEGTDRPWSDVIDPNGQILISVVGNVYRT